MSFYYELGKVAADDQDRPSFASAFGHAAAMPLEAAALGSAIPAAQVAGGAMKGVKRLGSDLMDVRRGNYGVEDYVPQGGDVFLYNNLPGVDDLENPGLFDRAVQTAHGHPYRYHTATVAELPDSYMRKQQVPGRPAPSNARWFNTTGLLGSEDDKAKTQDDWVSYLMKKMKKNKILDPEIKGKAEFIDPEAVRPLRGREWWDNLGQQISDVYHGRKGNILADTNKTYTGFENRFLAGQEKKPWTLMDLMKRFVKSDVLKGKPQVIARGGAADTGRWAGSEVYRPIQNLSKAEKTQYYKNLAKNAPYSVRQESEIMTFLRGLTGVGTDASHLAGSTCAGGVCSAYHGIRDVPSAVRAIPDDLSDMPGFARIARWSADKPWTQVKKILSHRLPNVGARGALAATLAAPAALGAYGLYNSGNNVARYLGMGNKTPVVNAKELLSRVLGTRGIPA